MPATCNQCKISLPCGCDKSVSTTSTTCPQKKQAVLWVVVRDENGKGVEGVPLAISLNSGSPMEKPTGGEGMYTIQLDPGTCQVDVVKVPDRLEKSHDLPQVSKKTVSISDGAISHVFFDLRLRTILKVELVGTNITGNIADVVKGAQVNLEQIVFRHFRNGREFPVTTDARYEKPAGCVATFHGVSEGKYRIQVALAPDKQKQYLAQDVQFEMKSGEVEKTVQVPVGELFKKVRFVGLCVAAVARQLWKGDDKQVVEYLANKHLVPAAVPDFTNRLATYGQEFINYWDATKIDEQKGHWKAKYNGLPHDPGDIAARVKFLKSAITQAKAGLGPDSDTVLKVFVAPECFFLGRYGAYPHEHFGTLIRALKDLVSDQEWQCWVFVFGTVNGFYELEGRLEMFNMSPVIRGGASGPAGGKATNFGEMESLGDPDKFTKLLQKAMFSQEIPGKDDLEYHGDELRVPLTEETVGAGFQATENEEVIGRKVMQILTDFRGSNRVAHAQKASLGIDEASALCTNVENAIKENGLYAFVRFIRGGVEEAKRRGKAGDWKDWMTKFKSVLTEYMADEPQIDLVVAEGARVMNAPDFCFSSLRVPGPWLDYVVEPGEQYPERNVTFALEICADHLQSRFMTAAKDTNLKIDIHLVPSAGAELNDSSLGRLVGEGYAFNCDGWNCKAGGFIQRNGKIVFVEDELAPRQSGHNPLMPHTELWQAKSDKAKETDQKQWEKENEPLHLEKKKFREEREEYQRLFKEWAQTMQGPQPVEPKQPKWDPETPEPLNFSYLATGVKVIELTDKVDHILPYESAHRIDEWKALEPKVKEIVIEAEKAAEEQKRQAAEDRRKQLGVDIPKEEQNLAALNNGVKTGPKFRQTPSLQDLTDEVATLEAKSPPPTNLASRKSALEKRRSDIELSEKKIADWKAELLKLNQPPSSTSGVTGAAQTGSIFKLPDMQKLAVPQLHIYPEQDLPVPA